ncbi:MAG: organomercurial lyase [Gemmatimonadota bacterium]
MTDQERRIRLFIYEFVVRNDRCPSLIEIAQEAGLTPLATQRILERLESVHSAIVLSPGSGNLWLADPFAALPTSHPVHAGEHHWFGMCVWDALGILSLVGVDGHAPTMCPVSGESLSLRVENGMLTVADGVVHLAVRARDWWRDVGFT